MENSKGRCAGSFAVAAVFAAAAPPSLLHNQNAALEAMHASKVRLTSQGTYCSYAFDAAVSRHGEMADPNCTTFTRVLQANHVRKGTLKSKPGLTFFAIGSYILHRPKAGSLVVARLQIERPIRFQVL